MSWGRPEDRVPEGKRREYDRALEQLEERMDPSDLPATERAVKLICDKAPCTYPHCSCESLGVVDAKRVDRGEAT